MLRSLNELEACALHAVDGAVGHVRDCYFEDAHWTLRYLIIETGSWLSRRKVLIAPQSIVKAAWSERVLSLAITREQIESSPDIDTAKPVARQHEGAFQGPQGFPHYGTDDQYWAVATHPGLQPTLPHWDGADSVPPSADALRARALREVEAHERQDPHLRSAKALLKYHIEAADGGIGHLDDLLFATDMWAVRYFVVNTGSWWHGHRVVIAPQSIREMRWLDRSLAVQMTRREVQDAPSFEAVLAAAL